MYVDQVTVADDRLSVVRNFTYGLGTLANKLLAGAIGCMSIVRKVGLGMNPPPMDTVQVPRHFKDCPDRSADGLSVGSHPFTMQTTQTIY